MKRTSTVIILSGIIVILAGALVGTLLLLLGIGLLITNPVPPVESSARFRLLKRIMDREEKEKGKDKRK